MANLNKVMIIGNLTRDPEIKYTPKGTAVADIAIAVNRTYTGPDGQKKEEVTYIDVVLWERLAELAGEYLKKGRPVFIEGRLQMDTWDDKATGQKRSKLRVRGESMQFLGSRDGSGGAPGAPSGGSDEDDGGGYTRQAPSPRPAPRPASAPRQQAPPADDGDDIPF